MGVFGDLDVRLDPWEVEYGSELPLSEEGGPDSEAQLDVECKETSWDAIAPGQETPPSRVIFVDGVRRLEARLLVTRSGRFIHGAFGSYAVGAIAVEGRTAKLSSAEAYRVVTLGSAESVPGPITVRPELTYVPLSTVSSEVDGPLRALQEEMRRAEERLAGALAEDPAALVLCDGPLSFEGRVRSGAIGYVKRLFKLYLPERLHPLLAALPPGARTPLFALRATERFRRYAWFVRLRAPTPSSSPLSGIARLEVSEVVGFESARRMANATASLLPRFAPARGRDPRSPQNLLPVGALEARLRHALGDGRLVRRAIESLLARESKTT